MKEMIVKKVKYQGLDNYGVFYKDNPKERVFPEIFANRTTAKKHMQILINEITHRKS